MKQKLQARHQERFLTYSFHEVSISVFLDFWASLYDYRLKPLYAENIHKDSFTIEDIEQLYKWKNGGTLSHKKKDSLARNILSKLDIVNRLKSKFCMETFRSEFEAVSAIWKIFLLHIIAPGQYPIFDQHVCRAYNYLVGNLIKEIPNNNNGKENVYFDSYVEFFNSIADRNKEIGRKKIDDSLWSFGKFLKSNYGKAVLAKCSLGDFA